MKQKHFIKYKIKVEEHYFQEKIKGSVEQKDRFWIVTIDDRLFDRSRRIDSKDEFIEFLREELYFDA